MNCSTSKKGIEKEFDYLCKRGIRDEHKDYLKYLKRLSKKETSFSMLDNHIINQFSTIDYKPSDYHIFSLDDYTVNVENDLLAEALKQLTSRKREIILLHYFMHMGTQEIADLLDVYPSTVYRNKQSALETMKAFMEGNYDEDLS